MSDTVFKVSGTVGIEANLLYGDVQVTKGNDLAIDVGGFSYDIGGRRGSYAGSTNNAITASDESYVYLSSAGTLTIVLDSVGWPEVPHLRLARVVADATRVTTIYDERPVLAASSGVVGTCRISYPVDGDIKGGDTSASSNNNWAAVRYDGSGTDTEARNRWVRRPPQNYISGDLVLRLYCSVASAIGNNKDSFWRLSYKFADVSDALGTMSSVTTLKEHDSQAADELFTIDLTIPSGSVDVTKDLMALYLAREHADAQDNMTDNIYVHLLELRYTGFLMHGQAGQ